MQMDGMQNIKVNSETQFNRIYHVLFSIIHLLRVGEVDHVNFNF